MTGPERPTFAAGDDAFHFDALGDDWWATETAWFSFHHPDRELGGWLYTLVRPNIGVVSGGAWVWDASGALPWEVRYHANHTCQPLPPDADLRCVELPTGVRISVREACTSYDLGYDDPGRLSVALRFDGVMAPEPMMSTSSTFGRARHFDQIGRVSGTIELHGETIDIDCLAVRDRTWGRRPEDRPRRAAYVTAVASEASAFLAVTDHRTVPEGEVAYGFRRRDGRMRALRGGSRRVERDPRHGWVERIEVELEDEDGHTTHAVGDVVSRIVLDRHSFIDINGLVRWTVDGEIAWGEDQDMWPVHQWAARERTESAR